MTAELKKRAKAFLEGPVPKEIKYVPGSLVEIFLTAYGQGGELDPDLIELAGLGAMEMDGAIEKHTAPAAKQYFSDCKNLLDEILKEVG